MCASVIKREKKKKIKDIGLSTHRQNQVFSAVQASGGLLINEFSC